MHLFRTKFKNGVVAEFLPPRKPSNNVIILCDGLPSLPAKNRLTRFLSRKGFWVFNIRYRGTWESEGEFLSHEPQEDILNILEELNSGFKSIWTGEEFKILPEKIFVMGTSFGGTTAIMSSLSEKVNKIIAFCPPIDWTAQENTEPLSDIKKIVREGYGGAYRFSDENWNNLESGDFFNPINHKKDFDSKKILIVHAEDDEVVSYGPVKEFARDIECKFISRKKGGHISSYLLMKCGMWRLIEKFLL